MTLSTLFKCARMHLHVKSSHLPVKSSHLPVKYPQLHVIQPQFLTKQHLVRRTQGCRTLHQHAHQQSHTCANRHLWPRLFVGTGVVGALVFTAIHLQPDEPDALARCEIPNNDTKLTGAPKRRDKHSSDGTSRAEHADVKPPKKNRVDQVGNAKDLKKRYRMNAMLGEGTFAIVRLAVDRKTRERVAVKEIDKDLSDREALNNEIDIMKATGKHQNIISLRAVYETPHVCYLVLDLAEGGELFDRIIEKGELTERQASKMFHDAISGLDHMHEKQICHLDIKPENLLLTSRNDDAVIKLADFGLAIHLGDGERCDACVGTPAYWAPEMVKREPFYQPVDIWALGCVLYIMLVGTHPFDPDGDSPEAQILARVAKGDYDKTNEQFLQISSSAKDLLRHMLDPNPEKRYTTKKILRHPWLSHAEELSDKPLPESHIARLRGFRVLRMLKAGMQHIIGKASADLFAVFDKDSDGLLSRDELSHALRAVGHVLSPDEIDEVLKILDIDGDGMISRIEFETVMNSTLDMPGVGSSIHDIEGLFKIFDRNGDGYIYEADFRHVLGLLGAAPTDSIVFNELQRADLDQDGKVDFAEFVHYVRMIEETRVKLGYASISSVHTPKVRGAHGMMWSRRANPSPGQASDRSSSRDDEDQDNLSEFNPED